MTKHTENTSNHPEWKVTIKNPRTYKLVQVVRRHAPDKLAAIAAVRNQLPGMAYHAEAA